MKQEGITGVVMQTTNPYFDSDSQQFSFMMLHLLNGSFLMFYLLNGSFMMLHLLNGSFMMLLEWS